MGNKKKKEKCKHPEKWCYDCPNQELCDKVKNCPKCKEPMKFNKQFTDGISTSYYSCEPCEEYHDE